MIDRIEDLEELLLATLDAVSRYRVGQRKPPARRSTPGPCSPKPRAGCNMGSGETGCTAWPGAAARPQHG